MSEEEKKHTPLTIKQERFVREVLTGQPISQAVVKAGYDVTSKHSAESLGSEMMRLPKIKNALQAALDSEYPDMARRAAEQLHQMLNEDTAPAVKLKVIEMLMKIHGWEAPKKSAHVRADLFVDKISKLPGEE